MPLEEPLVPPLEEPLVPPLEPPLVDPLVPPLEPPLEDPLVLPLEAPLDDPLELPLEEPLVLPLELPLDEPLLEPPASPFEPLDESVEHAIVLNRQATRPPTTMPTSLFLIRRLLLAIDSEARAACVVSGAPASDGGSIQTAQFGRPRSRQRHSPASQT
jgi:hypothetical protein